MSLFQEALHKVIGRLNILQGKGWGSSTTAKEVRQILGRVPPPQVVVDVGGNVGDWTGELLKLSRPDRVFIFEPSPVALDKLRGRFAECPNVKLMPFALSNSDQIATLFSNEDGSGLSSLHQRKLDHLGIEHKQVAKVQSKSFATFLREELVEFIDIIKLDIEGHELSVLNAIPTEFMNKVHAIQFEFGGCNIDSRSYFQDFWYLLSGSYQIFRMTPFGLAEVLKYRELDEHFSTTNYLCIRK